VRSVRDAELSSSARALAFVQNVGRHSLPALSPSKGAWGDFSEPYLLEAAHSLEPSSRRVQGGAPRSNTSGGAEAGSYVRRGLMALGIVDARVLKYIARPGSPRRRRKSTSTSLRSPTWTVVQRQLFLPIALTHDFCYRGEAGCLT
jgi:hypothetical protein